MNHICFHLRRASLRFRASGLFLRLFGETEEDFHIDSISDFTDFVESEHPYGSHESEELAIPANCPKIDLVIKGQLESCCDHVYFVNEYGEEEGIDLATSDGRAEQIIPKKIKKILNFLENLDLRLASSKNVFDEMNQI